MSNLTTTECYLTKKLDLVVYNTDLYVKSIYMQICEKRYMSASKILIPIMSAVLMLLVFHVSMYIEWNAYVCIMFHVKAKTYRDLTETTENGPSKNICTLKAHRFVFFSNLTLMVWALIWKSFENLLAFCRNNNDNENGDCQYAFTIWNWVIKSQSFDIEWF